MKGSTLLPVHIPGGQGIKSEQLDILNRELRRYESKIRIAVIIHIGIFLLDLFYIFIVGKPVGIFVLTGLFILYPVFMIFFKRRLTFRIWATAEGIGIDPETFTIALGNRNDDLCAWGRPVSRDIFYRFKCRRCKHRTDWFCFTLTSCTEDTMRDKSERFKRLTLKKGKYYIGKSGLLRYSLSRECPFCGKLQRKQTPRLWTIPLFTFCGMLIYVVIRFDNNISSLIKSDEFFVTLFLFLTVCGFVVSFLRYMFLQKPAGSPQYAFTEDLSDVTVADRPSVEILRYFIFGLNCISAVVTSFLFLEDAIGKSDAVSIVIASAISAAYLVSLIALFLRKKIAFILIGVTLLSSVLYSVIAGSQYRDAFASGLPFSMMVLSPALMYLPFCFKNRSTEDDNGSDFPYGSEK